MFIYSSLRNVQQLCWLPALIDAVLQVSFALIPFVGVLISHERHTVNYPSCSNAFSVCLLMFQQQAESLQQVGSFTFY